MRCILTSLVLLFAFGAFAFGQQAPNPAPATNSTPAPAHAVATPNAATPDTSGKYKLREGTDVNLQFAEDLSSSTSFEGDPVTLTLANDLKVGDVVVAKAGSKASGQVTKAQKPGMMGKAGQLDIRLEYLKAGDVEIKLRGTKENVGEGRVKGALLTPFGRIKHGKNVDIKAGDPLHAYVAQDILLPPVS
jgi:hypothetical protein